MAFHALADYQNHVIGWLQWEQSSLGDGAVVRFPRIWMSSGECRLTRRAAADQRGWTGRWSGHMPHHDTFRRSPFSWRTASPDLPTQCPHQRWFSWRSGLRESSIRGRPSYCPAEGPMLGNARLSGRGSSKKCRLKTFNNQINALDGLSQPPRGLVAGSGKSSGGFCNHRVRSRRALCLGFVRAGPRGRGIGRGRGGSRFVRGLAQ